MESCKSKEGKPLLWIWCHLGKQLAMLDSLLLPLNYTFMKLDFIVGLLQYFLFVCHSENSGCVNERGEHEQRSGWMAGRDRGWWVHLQGGYLYEMMIFGLGGEVVVFFGWSVDMAILTTVARLCWTCGRWYLKISPHSSWFCFSFYFLSAIKSDSFGVQRN